MARAGGLIAVEAPDLRIELAPVAEAYERAGRRLVDLLRSVTDPTAPTKGLRWTLGELTAHLAARTELFAGYLAGTALPEGEVGDIAPTTTARSESRATSPSTRTSS